MDRLGIQILINVLIVMLILGVFYRVQTNELNEFREKVTYDLILLNESLAVTQKVLFQQVTSIKADTELEIATVQKQLSDSMNLVQKAIDALAKETKTSIGSIEIQLYQVETTKEKTLSKLQRELGKLTAGIGDFSLIVDKAKQSVVQVKTTKQSGSGAIIDPTGVIVTNYHVVQNGGPITIDLPDKTTETAEMIGYDAAADIALLKIANKKNFPALAFGDSSLVDVGDPVIAIGYPGGLDLAVSQGIISATNRIGTNNMPLFQTDVAISLGSSGGPLLDASGKIIGINVGIHYLNLLGYERFGFSIKGNYVKKTTEKIHPGLG